MLQCSLLKNPFQNRPLCWSIVVKEKPTVGSPFFRAFSSDRVSKGKKTVNVRFFVLRYYITGTIPAIFCKLYQRILGTF
jgi:hypothetical protein